MPIIVPAALLSAGLAVTLQQAGPGEDDRGDHRMRQIMATAITRGGAQLDAHLLGLEGDALAVALELHKDYLRRYRASADTTREAYRAFDRASMLSGAELARDELAAARRARDEHRRTARELQARYLADLGVLAFDAPPGALERVERARDRGLARALIGPHTTTTIIDPLLLARSLPDPIDLVAPADGAATPAGVLMEFERAVAPSCVRIITLAEGIHRNAAEAQAQGEPYTRDDDAADRQTIARLAAEIRAQTDRAVSRVSDMLPDDQHDRWILAYNQQRWPEAYAPGPFEAALRGLPRLPDLTHDQREQIKTITLQYRRTVDPVRARYARANDELGEAIADSRQSRSGPDPAGYRERRAAVDAAIERVKDAKADRGAIASRYLKQLRGVLTPEQLDALDLPDQ